MNRTGELAERVHPEHVHTQQVSISDRNLNIIGMHDQLVKSLRFLVDASKTEPGMNIYRAHIEQAETLLKLDEIA